MSGGDDLINPWLDDLKPAGWQGFVYFSEAIDAVSDPSLQSFHTRVFPLSTMQVGDRVRIVSLNCGDSNGRLMSLGLMPNVVLEIVSCTPTGSVIVALQDQRLGLSADMAQQIQVIDAEQQLGEDQLPNSTRMSTMPLHPVSSASSTDSSADPSTDRSTHLLAPSAIVKLRNAAIGSRLKIVGYEPVARDYKRKLLAMGLTPGTELLVKRHAPLGDPTEIEVRGFRLSLRKHEADALMVETI